MASVIVVEPDATPAAGVNVPTQVKPPSADVMLERLPTVASLKVKSAAGSKPATFSENVTVTFAVSPIASALSSTVTVAVGAVVSRVYLMTFDFTLSFEADTSVATTEMKYPPSEVSATLSYSTYELPFASW